MKRILCFLMACTMCASAAVGLSGCGCDDNTSSNSSKPGYKVEPTEPDLTNGDFGFFIINQEELMITKYTGSDTVIEIPESYKNYKVTVIGASVFNNSKITEVTIPSSIKQIEDYAFSSCHSLTKVNLSEGLEILNNSVFFNCSELREIKLPSTLKEIGPRAFSGAALNNVVLPDSGKLTKIDEYAFYQSRELTDITIPACITSIPDNVFADCSKEVTIHGASGSYAQSYAKKNNLKFKADLGSSSKKATKATKASGKAAEKAE